MHSSAKKKRISSELYPEWLESVEKKRFSTASSIKEFNFAKSRVRQISGPDTFPNLCENAADGSSDVQCGGLLYWMVRDQRVQDNWAFLYAQRLAMKFEVPLHACFCLVPAYQADTLRHFSFMVGGLKEVEEECLSLHIPFHLLDAADYLHECEDPSAGWKHRWSDINVISNEVEKIKTSFYYESCVANSITNLVRSLNIGCLIVDFSPLHEIRAWVHKVSKSLPTNIPFCEVDAHNIVPVWCGSDKLEYSARTIRPKLFEKSPKFLTEFPPLIQHPFVYKDLQNLKSINWEEIMSKYNGDRAVKPVDWAIPGTRAAFKILYTFIEERLSKFDSNRNNPVNPALSGLSCWFHFGQIAPQRAVLEVVSVQKDYGRNADIFVEEAFNRRELAENFCFFVSAYNSIEGKLGSCAYKWARETLSKHSTDERNPTYKKCDLENAKTHDDLWNAAQHQLLSKGKMHGFLRQYWAKKILEWCKEGPEVAIRTAIYLNDRYSLDGSDPNGYVGIMWAICGIHDQGWPERPIFGKIRFMNYQGCARKFSIPSFVSRYSV